MARAWTSVRVSKWEAFRPEDVASQRGRSENVLTGAALGSFATSAVGFLGGFGGWQAAHHRRQRTNSSMSFRSLS